MRSAPARIARHRVLGALDAADAHDHRPGPQARAHALHHLDGARSQRWTAQPSRADRLDARRVRRQAGARDRGVGRDHSCEAHLFDDREERLDPRVVEVGRDLEQQRHRRARPPESRVVVRLRERHEERARERGGLHRAQVLGVRRRYVDDHEIGPEGARRGKGREVVGDDALEVVDGHGARLTDRDADGDPRAAVAEVAGGEAPRDANGPLVGEAEAVHEGAVAREPKEVRPRVRLLGERRHGAELEMSEGEGGERARAQRVLVEAAGEPEGGGELEAHRSHGDARIARREDGPRQAAQRPDVFERREAGEGQRVRRVGRQQEEQRTERPGVERHGPLASTPGSVPVLHSTGTQARSRLA
jgi:hypothetical protein